MATGKTAFVTGASRGIGKVVAIWLAKTGFDVAITARSRAPGEQREHSPTAARSDTSPLPGSLQETAAEIERLGRTALTAPADITDPASVAAAAATVLERWGPVDVLVNCARHIGYGHMDKVLDTPTAALRATMEGNFFTPVLLTQMFAPGMAARKSGIIINFDSTSAFSDPGKPAGEGGWGICYGATKGAFHRLAGIVALELAGSGVLCFNLDPGYTWTERIEQDMARFGFNPDGAPPEVSGAVVAWLVSHPEAAAFNGRTVFAQPFCAEHGLLPSWDHGPALQKLRTASRQLDRCGVNVSEGKSVSD